MTDCSESRLSADDRTVADSVSAHAESAGEAAKIWDAKTGQELLTLAGKGSLLYSVSFIEGGNTLLLGGNSIGSWQLWRAPSWEEIVRLESDGRGWLALGNP